MTDMGELNVRQSGEHSGEQSGERRRTRRVLLAVGAAAVAVLGAAGAGFAAGTVVSGGGTQPEDVLPAGTVVFADVDLDPAADQKLNVARLLGRLPDVADDYGSEPDPRSLIVKLLTEGEPFKGTHVDDWIGDRMGVGVVWDEPTESLTSVVVLQTSDADAAMADLAPEVGSTNVAVIDDFVLVTATGGEDSSEMWSDELLDGDHPTPQLHTQTAAEVVAAAQAAPLGAADGFADAFDHLDDGLASFYVDGAAMADLGQTVGVGTDIPADSLESLADAGQSAAVLRAESDAIELRMWSSAALPSTAGPASLAGGLPDDTVLAVEATGGAELVTDRWQAIVDAAGDAKVDRALAEVEARLGVRLPDDLETLAGEDAVLAVDGGSLLTGIPGAGIRSITDPEAAADLADRLQPSLATLTGGFGLVAEGTDDGMVLATSSDYAAALTSGDGGLGTSERFTRALPDVDGASYLAWVDLAALTGPLQLAAPDAADTLGPMDSLGVTVGPDDGGTAIRARLVFAEDGT